MQGGGLWKYGEVKRHGAKLWKRGKVGMVIRWKAPEGWVLRRRWLLGEGE